MTECFKSANGRESPASWFRGQKPITGCFITQGIDCVNAYVSSHQAGAGDHRYWILDFCAKSVLGVGYPHLVRPKGRRLKCVVERTRLAYNKKLYQLSCRHRMWTKMDLLTANSEIMSRADLSEGMNKFDGEHVQHKVCSEDNCNQFFNGSIDFCPEVQLWIKRRDLYQQLQSINRRLCRGIRVNTTHFIRSCTTADIKDPFLLTDDEVQHRYDACLVRLFELEPVAPMLRVEHLSNCHAEAKARGDRKAMMRIREIKRNERQRRRWGGLNWATKGRRGGAPTAIKVKTPEGDVVYDTRQEVEEQASRRLTDRFKLARDAPISQGKLFDDIGYLGDTTATKAILEGTYEFPPDMDPHTRLLTPRIFT
jgi:hypothetical protein